jgi:hypothetical protein
MKWAVHVACMGEMGNAYKILVGILESFWDDNIKMNYEEIGWENVDFIRLAQDRDKWRALVNTVMNLPD